MVKRLVVLLVLLGACPAAAHGASWKSGGTIFADTPIFGALETAVDRSGNTLFAYPGGFNGGGVFARARPSGGPVAPRQTLSGADAQQPHLAANAKGEALVAWSEASPGTGSSLPDRELAALRLPGGAFAGPQVLAEGVTVCDDAAAMSNSGYAVVAFTAAAADGRCLPYASLLKPGSDHFDPPVQLSTNRAATPQVALDNRGNALVAWVDKDSDAVLISRYLPHGLGFQTSQRLFVDGQEPAAPDFGPLLLRVSPPTGAAIIAFPSLDGFRKRPAVSIGGTVTSFDPPRLLAGPSSFNSAYDRRVDAAAGADGTLAVVWRGGDRQMRRVKIARVGPGAESITRDDVNAISDLHAAEVALAIADDGRVTVAWSRLSAHGKRDVVEAATCAPSEHCGRPQLLSSNGLPGGVRPEAATSSSGVQFVSWLTPTGVDWAMGSAHTGRFGKAHRLTSATDVAQQRLLRGRHSAMLATVVERATNGMTAKLFTYAER